MTQPSDHPQFSATGIAYQRTGPRGQTPVVLVHAGIADRRMWDPLWWALSADHDVLRLDLRGFGDSTRRPRGPLSPTEDLQMTLTEAGISSCHLVGASFGAGIGVELALIDPAQVRSLLLVAPGGSLIEDETQDLAQFIAAEDEALDRGDLDAAAQANVHWWVDGPRRGPADVDPAVRSAVHQMQRRAFELTQDWDDVEEQEMSPPAIQRLAEITVPTWVLVGDLDLQAIRATAATVARAVPAAKSIEWDDAAHLPSLEHPERFLGLVQQWLTATKHR